MDQVQQPREQIVITKYGQPVVKLVPVEQAQQDSILGFMQGTVQILGDIVSPIDEVWEAEH